MTKPELKSISKVCSCGEKYDKIPANHKFHFDEDFGGFYWDCKCGSTLWVPTEQAIKLKAA